MMCRLPSKWIVLFVPTAFFLGSCHGRGSTGRDLDMLTKSPWKYEKAGFDSDDDGVFDALDPQIAGCDRDNTIIFRTDGTGTVEEGSLKCVIGGPDSLPFMWSFQDNDSTIYFQDQYYKVRSLTSDHLEMYADQKLGGINSRYVIVLRH